MKLYLLCLFVAVAYAAPSADPEADPEADPALLLRRGYGLGYGYGYGRAIYGGYPYYGYGARLIGKRSAEPEPEPQYLGRRFGGRRFLGGRGFFRGGLFRGRLGKRSADADPEATPEADPEAEADPALLLRTVGYPGYGYYGSYGYPYYGYGAGLRYVGKRSADPEPEPILFPFGLRLGRRRGLFGRRRIFGKRSADAEPEAEAAADPALLYRSYGWPAYGYAGYGYGYPYGAGYYGSRVIYG